ncbi:MAG: hypothetical protein ACLS4S_08695 [Bacteroides nordii]|jgi:hypothetical protein|uniref:hypothetical protein n=1 Tax=Bacteroides sp. TaxID=29523 RepID=UPI0025B9324C|nr:hypothetical protein [Bacteroides sp.]
MKKLLRKVILLIITIGGRLSLSLSNRVKKTNWWMNQSLGMESFISPPLFRVNYVRNYDVLNLGNKRAQCAFIYENIKGLNLASTEQSLAVDFKVLKFYFSYLKKSGVVIIPIDLFTSVTSNNENFRFYSKFIREFPESERDIYKDYYTSTSLLLDATQIPHLPYVINYKRYPFVFHPFESLKRIISDETKDESLICMKQTHNDEQLNREAINWYNAYKKRLHLNEPVSGYLPTHLERIWNSNRNTLKEMIAFCIERELRVAVVVLPISKHVVELIPTNVLKECVNSFIEGLEKENITVLDYYKIQELRSSALYVDAIHLNRFGAHEFTDKLVRDCKSCGLL